MKDNGYNQGQGSDLKKPRYSNLYGEQQLNQLKLNQDESSNEAGDASLMTSKFIEQQNWDSQNRRFASRGNFINAEIAEITRKQRDFKLVQQNEFKRFQWNQNNFSDSIIIEDVNRQKMKNGGNTEQKQTVENQNSTYITNNQLLSTHLMNRIKCKMSTDQIRKKKYSFTYDLKGKQNNQKISSRQPSTSKRQEEINDQQKYIIQGPEQSEKDNTSSLQNIIFDSYNINFQNMKLAQQSEFQNAQSSFGKSVPQNRNLKNYFNSQMQDISVIDQTKMHMKNKRILYTREGEPRFKIQISQNNKDIQKRAITGDLKTRFNRITSSIQQSIQNKSFVNRISSPISVDSDEKIQNLQNLYIRNLTPIQNQTEIIDQILQNYNIPRKVQKLNGNYVQVFKQIEQMDKKKMKKQIIQQEEKVFIGELKQDQFRSKSKSLAHKTAKKTISNFSKSVKQLKIGKQNSIQKKDTVDLSLKKQNSIKESIEESEKKSDIIIQKEIKNEQIIVKKLTPIQEALQNSKNYQMMRKHMKSQQLKRQNIQNIKNEQQNLVRQQSSQSLFQDNKNNIEAHQQKGWTEIQKYSNNNQIKLLETQNHHIFQRKKHNFMKRSYSFQSFNQKIMPFNQEDQQNNQFLIENECTGPSPYTEELNYQIVVKDIDNENIQQNEFQKFMKQINFIFNLNDQSFSQKQKKRNQRVFQIGSMTSDQILNEVKEKNKIIFEASCKKISHLVKNNMQSQIKEIEPMQEYHIVQNKISASFYQIKVQGNHTPLKIMLKKYYKQRYGDQKVSDNEVCDVSMYYSFKNRFPCEGKFENDGFLNKNDKLLVVQPYGENIFTVQYVYVGIYTRNGIDDTLLFQYGKNAEHQLQSLIFRERNELLTTFKQKFVDSIKENQVIGKKQLNAYQKLQEFKRQTNLSVEQYIEDNMERYKFDIILQESIHRMKQKGLLSKHIHINLDCDRIEVKSSKNTKKVEPQIKNVGQQIEVKEHRLDIENKFQTEAQNGHATSRKLLNEYKKVQFHQQKDSKYENSQYSSFLNFSQDSQDHIQPQLTFQDLSHPQKAQFYKEQQMKEIKRIEMERYKLCLFFTIKHDILKQIKEQKLDELIAILRKRKFVRTFINYQKVQQITLTFSKNFGMIKQIKARKLLMTLNSFVVQKFYKAYLNKKYGRYCTIDERLQRSVMRPQLSFMGQVLKSNFNFKCKFLLEKVLRDYKIANRGKICFFKFVKRWKHIKKEFQQNVQQKKDCQFKILLEIEECIKNIQSQILKLKPNIRKSYDFISIDIFNSQKENKIIRGHSFSKAAIEMANQYYSYHRSIFKMDQYRYLISNQEFNIRPQKVKNIFVENYDKILNQELYLKIIETMQERNISIIGIYYILKPYLGQIIDYQKADKIFNKLQSKNIKAKVVQYHLNKFRDYQKSFINYFQGKLQKYPLQFSENTKFSVKKPNKNLTKKIKTEKFDENNIKEDTVDNESKQQVDKKQKTKIKKGKNKKSNYSLDLSQQEIEEEEKDLDCTNVIIEKYYTENKVPLINIDYFQHKFDIDSLLKIGKYRSQKNDEKILSQDLECEVDFQEFLKQEREQQIKNLWSVNIQELFYKSLVFFTEKIEGKSQDAFNNSISIHKEE